MVILVPASYRVLDVLDEGRHQFLVNAAEVGYLCLTLCVAASVTR